MKKLLLTILAALGMTIQMSAATDGKFQFSYPSKEEIPYNLGYQYSVYDLKESEIEGWRVMYLNNPVTLTYNITSEEKKTVEVVFDPSYLELVDIVIPDKAIDPATGEEYTVTAIGKMAFDDCPEIRSVIMGDSITRIEDYAFNMCENKVLHKIGFIRFSQNLTHIGNYAFKNCHNLTTGQFTEGDQYKIHRLNFIKSVEYPFYGYSGRLTGLDNYLLLPASVEYIGKHAFEGCYFERDDNHLNYGLCKVKIPNPSCEIDDYAFAGCKFLELITLGEELNYDGLKNPSPVTDKKGRIGNFAFADCNLMRLDIPSSIASIGENAFINCFNRMSVKTPRSQEGRVYFDALNWFYPRSLFDNESDQWNSWNFDQSYDSDKPNTGLDSFKEEYTKYLERWHTNTVTIHSDKTKIGFNAFANNPQLLRVIINGEAGDLEAGAFRNCTNLKYVVLPEDLTMLSSCTFMNCSGMDSITIPNSVTEIGDSAFYQCKNLKDIELPSNLKKVNPYTFFGCEWLFLNELPSQISSIENYAFYGCKNIETITIPDNVTSIGDYAFADCYMHEFIRVNDVPKFYYGLTHVKFGDGVKTIGAHAFDGCRHLGHIEFGNSVEAIGEYAFQNCMNCPEEVHDPDLYTAYDVVLPNSLTTMGTGVFQSCSDLPSVTLGDKMTTLPDYAFAYCSNLTSVVNISNITSANKNVFLGCYSLEDFGSIFEDEEDVEIVDGIIYNHSKTEVISALPNITDAEILEGVTKIHDNAFANCGALQFVLFPSTLEEIGSRAFENCVSLPDALLINVKMGEFVYAGCTGIEIVEIDSDFTQKLNDNWFAGCVNMTGIIVSDDNEVYTSYEDELLLDKNATTLLRAPSGISYIDLPETVTKIEEYACSNCINLYDVELPTSVTHIGAHAFENCYDEHWESGLRAVIFKNPAVTIGEYAFNGCKDLSEVIWEGEAAPNAMGSIGAYAFNDCEYLIFKNDDLASAVISSLEPYAFANFPGLEEIELPETLETIGDHAFENCSNLSSVVFPESLKKIGNSAFKSSGLTYLDLPDTIEEIGDSAFMDCSKVMALKLPSGLKKINAYTFYKCFSGAQFDEKPEENFNLSIEIPESVESIGDYAFYGCVTNSNKYHGDSGESYSKIHHFYYYGLSSLSIGKNVKTIGAHAFDGCTYLLDITMGDAVTSIGDYAFKDCFKDLFKGVREVEYTLTGFIEKDLDSFPVVWQLDEITPKPISLPEDLTSLGEGAFYGCVELPSINVPASLTDIPAHAFNGCGKLLEIKLPEGIKSIGEKAFGGCKSVKEISIPTSLEKGSRVFFDCDSALKVTYHAEVPKTFDEGFFSPKVYSSKEAVIYTPNALLEKVKGITPWALFYKIVAKDETLIHLERVLETKNGLRFRVLSNKPNPYCEVAGPIKKISGTTEENAVSDDDPTESEEEPFEPTTYIVPEYVKNIDEESEYFGQSYKVIRIGNDAFEGDLTLVGITIPESVIEIGQEAFNGCKNLPEITLPKSITNIGERAFNQCYGLTYFEVPPLVTRLNPGVLKDCRGLYSIRMHDNIEELCAEALMDCRHLRAFERSENWKLRLIDDYALKNCIELEEINIPEGVEKIGKEAMYYCQKLKTVSLPESLLELGEMTFDDCEELKTIKVYTEIPPKMIGERHLTDQTCKIYVQAKNVDDYKNLWTVHEHRIEPGIHVTQPTRNEMPEYIQGSTYKFTSVMPLDGQTMTWSALNKVVATPNSAHDGTFHIQAVGPTHIKVMTDQMFYHECDLDVYPQLADANWDSRFDISDAVNIANYVVQNPDVLNNWWRTNRTDLKSQNEWFRFYSVGADVNKDGGISISDASATVKKVLAQEVVASAPARMKASDDTDDLTNDALIIGANYNGSIPVGLFNNTEYVALQANISVAEGQSLKDVKVGKRAAGHALSTRRIDDRTMRVILFDVNNAAFTRSDASLLELVVSGETVKPEDIMIYDIVASDIASNSHELSFRTDGNYSGVETHFVTDSDVVIRSAAEGIYIENAAFKNVTIYTVDGRVVLADVLNSDSELIHLSNGLYVVSVEDRSYKIAVK